MNGAQLLDIVGGVPLTQNEHGSRALLELVRRRRLKLSGAEGALAMQPEAARLMYETHARSPIVPIPSRQLQADESHQLDVALADLATDDLWRQALDIPICWAGITGDEVSATSVLIPQHIYIGAKAFTGEVPLRETILHEVAHVWMGFMVELADFQRDGVPAKFVLPSGTSGKSLRSVLFASHFALTAGLMYERMRTAEPTPRHSYVVKYAIEALASIRGHAGLTDFGFEVHSSLASSAEHLSDLLITSGERP